MKFHRGDRVRIISNLFPEYNEECYVTYGGSGVGGNYYKLTIDEGQEYWEEDVLESAKEHKFCVGEPIIVNNPINCSIGGVVSSMKPYAGKMGFITEIYDPTIPFGGSYFIDVDDERYYWRGAQLTSIENTEKLNSAYAALFGKEVS